MFAQNVNTKLTQIYQENVLILSINNLMGIVYFALIYFNIHFQAA